MIKDFFIMAFRNLSHRGLRTWLTMIGIFISIATIFTLVSLSLGLQGAVEEQFRLLGTDKIFVQSDALNLGVSENVIMTVKDVETIEKVRGVKDYTYITFTTGEIEYNNQKKFLPVYGLPLGHTKVYEETGLIKFEEGQFLDDNDNHKVLLGYNFQTQRIFKDPVLFRDNIKINGERYQVSGLIKEVGNPQDDQNILIPIDEFRELFDIPERVDYIMVQIEPGEDVLEVAERIEDKLLSSRGQTEKTKDFSISTPEDLLDSFKTILNIITAFLIGVAAISLVVGAIGIANTMYTSVIERTKEIGIMKAIGAKNSDIMLIFLIEAGLLGLVGGVIGVGLGFGISQGIEFIATESLGTNLLQASSPVWLIFGCLAFGFVIGALSGLLPAWQASKTNVVDALRYE